MAKVLLVGGSGFVGSHVVDKLLDRGHSVRVFDRQPERFRSPLREVEYHFGDFADRMALVEALAGVEVVFHLLSTTLPGTGDLDPKVDVQDNLVGTLNLLESMDRLGIRRILFLSSGGTVYGVPDILPIPESHPLRPLNSYGIVKVSIELYLDMYRRLREFSPIVIRASNPFGPRQAHSGVQGIISTFFWRILAGEPVEIWGDGSVVRDYFAVSDLAEFCALAGTGKTEGVYNAGSGHGTSISEIVEAIRAVTQVRFDTVYKPGRPIDVPRSVLDCSRAKSDFGWESKTQFVPQLQTTWKWIKDHSLVAAGSSP
jgi:UDP-glucose 4-epimerase